MAGTKSACDPATPCGKISPWLEQSDAAADDLNFPLSRSEIDHFIERGFVMLKNAFSREASQHAKDFLWSRIAKDGITKDPRSWTRRHGIAEVYTPDDCVLWHDILTARLRGAIDQLCGPGRTGVFGCGWWVVTFPGVTEAPWGVDGSWHVDGAGYRHFLDSPEIGLLPIFLFNDIGPCDGGTVLKPGSHRKVAQLLLEAGETGVDGGYLSRLARAKLCKDDEDDFVEVNGNEGDVMLVHPFLLHARSKNLGQLGIDSVRFMCHPAVPMKDPLRVHGEVSDDATPVFRYFYFLLILLILFCFFFRSRYP